MDKDWRDSNAPKWVKDAVEKEMAEWRLTAALSWPTEAKPEPVPFRWGEYDRLIGEVVPGLYWSKGYEHHVHSVEIRESETGWKKWQFRINGENWTSTVQRGPLFLTRREAQLYVLWTECEEAARHLLKVRNAML